MSVELIHIAGTLLEIGGAVAIIKMMMPAKKAKVELVYEQKLIRTDFQKQLAARQIKTHEAKWQIDTFLHDGIDTNGVHPKRDYIVMPLSYEEQVKYERFRKQYEEMLNPGDIMKMYYQSFKRK